MERVFQRVFVNAFFFCRQCIVIGLPCLLPVIQRLFSGLTVGGNQRSQCTAVYHVKRVLRLGSGKGAVVKDNSTPLFPPSYSVQEPRDSVRKTLTLGIPITKCQFFAFQKRFEKQLVILPYGINMFFFSY